MNILLVANDPVSYGAGHSLMNIVFGLKKKGIHIFVAVAEEDSALKKRLEQAEIKYVGLPVRYNCSLPGEPRQTIIGDSLVNLTSVLKLIYFIRHWKIDLVHTNNVRTDIGAEAAMLTHKPHVWHIREHTKESFDLDFNFAQKTYFLMKHSKAIVCVSKDIKREYERILKSHNIVTVYNGVALEDYWQEKDSYLVNKVTQLLLCGSVHPGKGQMEAIKAVDILVNRGIKNIHLKIVGSGTKPYILSLKNFIASRELNEYVELVNYTENLQLLRAQSDIALVCSKREAFGRVTVESMLSELFVIGANTGGTKELIGDDQRGALYEQGNAEDLADKIEYVVNHKDEVIKRIRCAKRFAANNCSEERLTQKLIKIYEYILVSPIRI